MRRLLVRTSARVRHVAVSSVVQVLALCLLVGFAATFSLRWAALAGGVALLLLSLGLDDRP